MMIGTSGERDRRTFEKPIECPLILPFLSITFGGNHPSVGLLLYVEARGHSNSHADLISIVIHVPKNCNAMVWAPALFPRARADRTDCGRLMEETIQIVLGLNKGY
jgi:hypothetical protein